MSERIGLCAQSWPQEMENITKVRCLLYPYNSSETVYPWSLEHQSLRPHGETASNSNKTVTRQLTIVLFGLDYHWLDLARTKA